MIVYLALPPRSTYQEDGGFREEILDVVAVFAAHGTLLLLLLFVDIIVLRLCELMSPIYTSKFAVTVVSECLLDGAHT